MAKWTSLKAFYKDLKVDFFTFLLFVIFDQLIVVILHNFCTAMSKGTQGEIYF